LAAARTPFLNKPMRLIASRASGLLPNALRADCCTTSVLDDLLDVGTSVFEGPFDCVGFAGIRDGIFEFAIKPVLEAVVVLDEVCEVDGFLNTISSILKIDVPKGLSLAKRKK